MKRTLTTTLMALLLCVCMILGLAACGGFTQDDIDNAVNEATSPLNEQIAALEADIAEKEAKITALEGEKTALTTEKTELIADIEEIEAEVTALETEKATLEAEVAALEEEKASLTSDKADLEEQITTLNGTIATKNNEIATLNSSISALNTEKANLTARVTELEASITAKDTEIANLNSSVATLTTEKQALTNRVAELEAENAGLRNCLKDEHEYVTGECKYCEFLCEHNDTVVTDNVCECGITVATYTVQGATAVLTIPSNVSTPTITSSMNAINSLETTTLIVNGVVNNEQYQLVKNNLKNGTALFFADITTNNYIAANGAVYSCEIGSVSDEKYVLIVNERKSFQDEWNNYSTCISKLEQLTPGARVISESEAAWEKYLLKIKSDIPSDLSYWILADTKWGYWKESANEWYSTGWYGYNTKAFYWYPVFDVPLS